jgi:hypothetical protein
MVCHEHLKARSYDVPVLLKDPELLRAIEERIATVTTKHLRAFGEVFVS